VRSALASLTIALLALAPGARAKEIRVGLMTLEGPPETERSVEALASRSVTILPALEAELGVRFRERFRMVVIPESGPADSAIARLDAGAPEWAAGYLVPAQRTGAIRVARSSRYPYGTLESVLAHEATHMLLHDAGTRELPLWFEEGVATLEGRRWSLEDVMVYSTGLLTADLPSLAGLDSAFHATAAEAELAYAGSFAFVSRAVRRNGDGFLRRLLRAARDRPFPAAWREVTGASLEESERSWRRDSLIRYRWIPIITASSTLWIGITMLALMVGARRRRRMQLQREEWRREEAESSEGDEYWKVDDREATTKVIDADATDRPVERAPGIESDEGGPPRSARPSSSDHPEG
jgi:hypothetical protein